jgi:hypothetical protein
MQFMARTIRCNSQLISAGGLSELFQTLLLRLGFCSHISQLYCLGVILRLFRVWMCTLLGSSGAILRKTRSQTDLVNALLMETRKDAKGAVSPAGKVDMVSILFLTEVVEFLWALTHVSLWRRMRGRAADHRECRSERYQSK